MSEDTFGSIEKRVRFSSNEEGLTVLTKSSGDASN